MKSFNLTVCFLFFIFWSQAQNYSYTFSGLLSIEKKSEIERELNLLPLIKNVKIKYKEDSQRGEILFDLIEPEQNRTEGSQQDFSPVNIKSLLIKNGIEPIDYRTINK